MTRSKFRPLALASALGLLSFGAGAVPLVFSGVTATFAQNFDRNWAASEMIDGITSSSNGWAIYRNNGQTDQTESETALFQPAAPVAAGSQSFTFVITQNHGQSHTLGDFSLAYTTDAIATLVSASTLMNIASASSANGASFSMPSVGRMVVSGGLLDTDVYTITAEVNSAAPITGIFLNVINDPAGGLPFGGPGRHSANGNFVLTEFEASVTPVPEPGTWALMLAGLTGVAGWAARARRQQA